MDPINYNIDVKSPFDSAIGGFQSGLQMAGQLTALKQMQAQQAQQQQMQQDLASLSSNPNAGAKDYSSLMVRYPQLSENLKRAFDVVSPEQQQNTIGTAMQIDAALSSGNPDAALNLLQSRSQALRNSGNATSAAHNDTIIGMIQNDPTGHNGIAKTSVNALLASVMGADKYKEYKDSLMAQQLQPSKLAQSQAEAGIKSVEAANAPVGTALNNANVQSQIQERAARLGLDRDKLTSEFQLKMAEMNPAFKLGDDAKKIVNESAMQAVTSDQSASQMLDFANRMDQASASGGATAKGFEYLKSVTGNQDAVTALRQEYTRLRSGMVSKLLPPGPASDKDIQIAMAGFPADTANASQLSQFMRGMAKLQQFDSSVNNARSEWVNSVGHLGKPKQDIEISGVKIPAGSTFVDFAKQFINKKTDSDLAQKALTQVQSRGYMKYAQPQGSD